MLCRLLDLLLRPWVAQWVASVPPAENPSTKGTADDSEEAPIGGQAVMEGVMMRNGPVYALAVRHPDGSIAVESRPWFTLCRFKWMKKPFIRGFPVLLETLVNGIKALNRSAEQASAGEAEKMEDWHLILTLCMALCMAIALFVITPHLMSMGMQWLGLGGDVEGLSFHLWDGLFKLLIFVGYILAISLVPDIRRVFQYHGAEHKVIHTFESGGEVTATEAARMSRLHPRCGTTFLLFVISISIILHAVLVPAMLLVWLPQGAIAKHTVTILFKLLLMVPISALAYELIRCAARKGDTLWGKVLRAPGLVLQMLTTYEPDHSQLDVAVVALYAALGDSAPETVRPPSFRIME